MDDSNKMEMPTINFNEEELIEDDINDETGERNQNFIYPEIKENLKTEDIFEKPPVIVPILKKKKVVQKVTKKNIKDEINNFEESLENSDDEEGNSKWKDKALKTKFVRKTRTGKGTYIPAIDSHIISRNVSPESSDEDTPREHIKSVSPELRQNLNEEERLERVALKAVETYKKQKKAKKEKLLLEKELKEKERIKQEEEDTKNKLYQEYLATKNKPIKQVITKTIQHAEPSNTYTDEERQYMDCFF
tara:strand:+ start:368 stop:1111 length:744 start_codon:yes stop_codon:yes gene_type:complete